MDRELVRIWIAWQLFVLLLGNEKLEEQQDKILEIIRIIVSEIL